MVIPNFWIRESPHGLENIYNEIFSMQAIKFLQDIVNKFENQLEQVTLIRKNRNLKIQQKQWIPKFQNSSKDLNWKIAKLPERLKNRKIDLGDISPAHTSLFTDALKSNANGIQVDFDDGHCPTWRNTIKSFQNLFLYCNSKLPDIPDDITSCPLLLLRPRAFNMIEHNCMLDGKEVNGALFDFSLLMFHIGKNLYNLNIGPYFYLSKIEGSNEAKLWNDIFTHVENKMKLPLGTIRACVLIENILAAFSMEDILFEIKDHAIGLNCGIWDYCASIISKLGDYDNMIFPDRRKYININQIFIYKYMLLLINTCHKRGAIATAGMAPQVLPNDSNAQLHNELLIAVLKTKEKEIYKGFDGFLIFDFRLLEHLTKLWDEFCKKDNQIDVLPYIDMITAKCLITIPKGLITMDELRNNLSISMFFIYHWLSGQGIFFYKNHVEDSATAEISRLQLWQWIRHTVVITDQENNKRFILTRQIVEAELNKLYKIYLNDLCKTLADKKRMSSAKFILLEIITSKNAIEYLTTFLNDNHKFRAIHNKNDSLKAKI